MRSGVELNSLIKRSSQLIFADPDGLTSVHFFKNVDQSRWTIHGGRLLAGGVDAVACTEQLAIAHNQSNVLSAYIEALQLTIAQLQALVSPPSPPPPSA